MKFRLESHEFNIPGCISYQMNQPIAKILQDMTRDTQKQRHTHHNEIIQGASHYYTPPTNTKIIMQVCHQVNQSTITSWIHIIKGFFSNLFLFWEPFFQNFLLFNFFHAFSKSDFNKWKMKSRVKRCTLQVPIVLFSTLFFKIVKEKQTHIYNAIEKSML